MLIYFDPILCRGFYIITCITLLNGCISQQSLNYSTYNTLQEWQAPYTTCFKHPTQTENDTPTVRASYNKTICFHASTHDLTPGADNLASISKAVVALAPDFVIVEGLDATTTHDERIKLAMDAASCRSLQNCTEMAVALNTLSRSHKTLSSMAERYIGAEPDALEEMRIIMQTSQGEFDPADFMGLELTRATIAHKRLESQAEMDLAVRVFLQKVLEYNLTRNQTIAKMLPNYSIDQFESWLISHTGQGIAHVTEAYLDPYITNAPNITQRMSLFSIHARDVRLQQQIEKYAQIHKSILVIYGAKHLHNLFDYLSSGAKHISYKKYQ